MSNTVRAKFVCNNVTFFSKDPAGPREYTFTPQYDMSIPEDRRFQKATPWGEFKQRVDNPLVSFDIGQAYYLDLTPAPNA